MNGTNADRRRSVGPNPGPSWKAIGTGDFNDDGHSDILWQNTNGQAAIWEMNGTNVDRRRQQRRPQSWAELESDRNGRLQRRRPFRHPVAEHERSGRDLGNERDQRRSAAAAGRPQSWAELEGDRNGRLQRRRPFRHPVAEHERSGRDLGNERDQRRSAVAAVGPNPGPSWKAIGTGDFNDDGHSDILWQNANGQAAIWEMNGTNVDRRGSQWAPILGRVGKRSERATSTATVIPTSSGRTRAVRPRSGK